MDVGFSEGQIALRDAAREFVLRHVAPKAAEVDEREALDPEVVKLLREHGFFGISIPERYGGSFVDSVAAGLIVKEFAKGCASTAAVLAVHGGVAANHLVASAGEDLKAKYLPRLASGEMVGAWALTEPGAGSDPMAMESTAVRNGDHYVLDGTKHFITNGAFAGLVVVMAKTDPAAFHKGVSAFAVETSSPGFRVVRRERGIGCRGSGTAEIAFTDVRVPKENLIGDEGRGIHQALANLSTERLMMAAFAAGGCEGLLGAATDYAKERTQFGRPIYKFQGVYHTLAEMAVRARASDLLWLDAARRKDAGEEFAQSASIAKYHNTEACRLSAWDAMMVHGGSGFMREFPVERWLRDSLLGPIAGGTSNIQKMVIARGLGLDINPYE